ncbi:hypothetical protein LTR56_028267, partial [Elasticomyces elasticus]
MAEFLCVNNADDGGQIFKPEADPLQDREFGVYTVADEHNPAHRAMSTLRGVRNMEFGFDGGSQLRLVDPARAAEH